MSDETNATVAGAESGAPVLDETTTSQRTEANTAPDVAQEILGDEPETDSEPAKKSGSARLRERLDREIATRAALEERLRQIEASQAQSVATEKEPQEADYPDYFAFLAAKTKYDLRSEINQIKNQAAMERQQAQARAVNDTYLERASDFRKTVTDFDDVMAEAETLRVSDAMAEIITGSERGPALAYWLAKNPQTATKIANMAPLLAARELGRIESVIAPAKARTESKAPAPVKPLSGRVSAQRSLSEMSYEEYRKARMGGG